MGIEVNVYKDITPMEWLLNSKKIAWAFYHLCVSAKICEDRESVIYEPFIMTTEKLILLKEEFNLSLNWHDDFTTSCEENNSRENLQKIIDYFQQAIDCYGDVTVDILL